jgi:hypothetical protein
VYIGDKGYNYNSRPSMVVRKEVGPGNSIPLFIFSKCVDFLFVSCYI